VIAVQSFSPFSFKTAVMEDFRPDVTGTRITGSIPLA
jgi:hypothetical protein